MSRRIKFHDAMGLGNGWYIGAEDAGDGGVRTYAFREETRVEQLAALLRRARAPGLRRGRFRDAPSDLPARIEHAAIRERSRRKWYGSRPRDEDGPVELRHQQSRPVQQPGDEQNLIGSSLVRAAGSASAGQQFRDLAEYGRRHIDFFHPDTPAAKERDFRKRLRATGMRDEEIEHTVAEWRQGRPGGVEGRERLGVRTNAGANAGERLRPYYGVPQSLADLNRLNRTRDWGWGPRR